VWWRHKCARKRGARGHPERVFTAIVAAVGERETIGERQVTITMGRCLFFFFFFFALAAPRRRRPNSESGRTQAECGAGRKGTNDVRRCRHVSAGVAPATVCNAKYMPAEYGSSQRGGSGRLYRVVVARQRMARCRVSVAGACSTSITIRGYRPTAPVARRLTPARLVTPPRRGGGPVEGRRNRRNAQACAAGGARRSCATFVPEPCRCAGYAPGVPNRHGGRNCACVE